MRSISADDGCRDVQSLKPYAARARSVALWSVPDALCGVSLRMRAASDRAASKNAASFSSVSACSGVLVRTRRTVQNSRLVASNVDEARVGRGPADERVETATIAILARCS